MICGVFFSPGSKIPQVKDSSIDPTQEESILHCIPVQHCVEYQWWILYCLEHWIGNMSQESEFGC